MRSDEECQIQKTFCQYLQIKHPDIIFWSDLGGLKLPIGLAVKAKAFRPYKGVPDTIILHPARKVVNGNCVETIYCGLFIELKTKKGKASADQIKMIDRLIKAGYCAKICYGYNEAIETVEEYLGLGENKAV